eukprot:576469-Amphidinium_carterae.1
MELWKGRSCNYLPTLKYAGVWEPRMVDSYTLSKLWCSPYAAYFALETSLHPKAPTLISHILLKSL